MFINFDDMQHFGRTRFEEVRATAASTSKGLQAIADEATDYSKKSFDSARAYGEKLLEIRKPDELIELQSQFAKAAYDEFVARTTKFSKLYADLTKEAFEELTKDAMKPVNGASPAQSSAAASSWKAPVAAPKARGAEKQD